MVKVKTSFFCQECGAESPKWIGKCPSCGNWNTYVEEKLATDSSKNVKRFSPAREKVEAVKLNEQLTESTQRVFTDDEEFNRVLGGGIMLGSITLVGGEPGIGKSTLMLQIAVTYSKKTNVLYVSGEESVQQIQSRAIRLGVHHENCYLLPETDMHSILTQMQEIKPGLVVIDSIQTMHTDKVESAAGSVTQIRESTAELIQYAKKYQIPVLLIGHITKDGNIAGPKVLEHMVDVVLYFEGDRNNVYRILRSVKNRYGSTAEMAIYEMQQEGLRIVTNPSELLLSSGENDLSGIAVGATMEGMRPILIEAQALVSKAVYGTPQRSANGFDMRRLNMLLAVLEKRCGLRLGMNDVFLNIAGGIRVDDPAIDFAVIASIISSYEDKVLPIEWCFAGEVGLAGEVRAVPKIDQRVAEAARLGFTKIFISKHVKNLSPGKKPVEIVKIGKVQDFYYYLINQ